MTVQLLQRIVLDTLPGYPLFPTLIEGAQALLPTLFYKTNNSSEIAERFIERHVTCLNVTRKQETVLCDNLRKKIQTISPHRQKRVNELAEKLQLDEVGFSFSLPSFFISQPLYRAIGYLSSPVICYTPLPITFDSSDRTPSPKGEKIDHHERAIARELVHIKNGDYSTRLKLLTGISLLNMTIWSIGWWNTSSLASTWQAAAISHAIAAATFQKIVQKQDEKANFQASLLLRSLSG